MVSTEKLKAFIEGKVPVTENRALIRDFVLHRETKFVSVALAPRVELTPKTTAVIFEQLESLGVGGSVDIFLGRLGRATGEAWRLVSILRERFDMITAVVPYSASAGGTQVALGADAILMTEAASLSPIEPPLRRMSGDDSTVGMTSSFDVHHFLGFLKREFGLDDMTDEAAANSALWNRVDPLSVGAAERSYQNDRIITRRCLETHLDAEADRARINRIMNEVTSGVLSSHFPITRRDCEARLGLKVLKPGARLSSAVMSLHRYYEELFELEGMANFGGDENYLVSYDGFIDTQDERRILLRVRRCNEDGEPLANAQVLQKWVRPQEHTVVDGTEVELGE